MVNGNNLFAGTEIGIFKSTNEGSTWVSAGLVDTFISCLSKNENYLFAGTGYGLFRSPNNGSTWTLMNTGLTNPEINCLIVNGIYISCITDGVFVSTDNVLNWTEVRLRINIYLYSFDDFY